MWSSERINLLIWSYLALPPTLLQDTMLYTSYHVQQTYASTTPLSVGFTQTRLINNYNVQG